MYSRDINSDHTGPATLIGPLSCAQGEDQKKLDVVSNEVFSNALRASGRTGVIASEEEDVPVAVEGTNSGEARHRREPSRVHCRLGPGLQEV